MRTIRMYHFYYNRIVLIFYSFTKIILMDKQEKIAKLTLLLIYLTSWEEKESGTSVLRAWKGYDFDILDKLEEEGLITKSSTAKSLYLTEQGTAAAKNLEERMLSQTLIV